MDMIDLHTHTLFSDGVLVPSELARRARTLGYKALAFTDHVDLSNYENVTRSIVRFCHEYDEYDEDGMRILPGCEITHALPGQFRDIAQNCRDLGAQVIIAHGETIVEPVAPGTNRAAIEAGVDIIAHPGLLTDEDAELAGERGVALEISGRKGHSFTNGHVALMAKKHGATLVFSTDTHAPGDLMPRSMAEAVARGAGMPQDEVDTMFVDMENLVRRLRAG